MHDRETGYPLPDPGDTYTDQQFDADAHVEHLIATGADRHMENVDLDTDLLPARFGALLPLLPEDKRADANEYADRMAMYNFGRDVALTEKFDGDESALAQWEATLTPTEWTYIASRRRENAGMDDFHRQVAEQISRTAPELASGQLPPALAARIGDTYVLGSNQSGGGIGSIPDASNFMRNNRGINQGGANLNNNVLFFDKDTDQKAIDRALGGFYEHPHIGRFVIAIPTANAGPYATESVNSRAGAMYQAGRLPADVVIEGAPGNQVISNKYIAGFIDPKLGFVPNHNFMRHTAPNLSTGPLRETGMGVHNEADLATIITPEMRQIAKDPDNRNGMPQATREAALLEAQRNAEVNSTGNKRIVRDQNGVPYWGAEYPQVFTFTGQMRSKFDFVPKDKTKWEIGMNAAQTNDGIQGNKNTVIVETDAGEIMVIRRTSPDSTLSAVKQTFDIFSNTMAADPASKGTRPIHQSMLAEAVVIPGEPMILGKDPATDRGLKTRGKVTKITAIKLNDENKLPGHHPMLNHAQRQSNAVERYQAAIDEAIKLRKARAAGTTALGGTIAKP